MENDRVPSRLTSSRWWRQVLPYGIWVGTALAWAAAFVVVRAGVAEVPPFTFAAARTLLAAVVLVPLAIVVHPDRRPAGRELRFWALLGLPQIGVTYAALFWAAQYLPASITAILFATFPAFTALAAHLVVHDEPMTVLKLAGTLLAVLAVGLLVNPVSGAGALPVAPVVAVMVAVVAASTGAAVVRGHGRTTSTLWLTAIQLSTGGAMLLSLALIFERGIPFEVTRFTVWAILYLAFVVSVGCYLGLFWLLKRLDATFVAMGTILETALAVLLGVVFLGETVGGRSVGGLVLVVISVGMVSIRHWKQPAGR